MSDGTSTIRWGNLTEVSSDKGPYKLSTFDVDGAERICKVLDVSGIQTNPMKGSQAMIICPDGDEGRAIAIAIPPPAERTDLQKEGETTFTNHKDKQYIALKEGGHIEVKAKGNRTENLDGNHDEKVGGNINVTSGGILHLNPA